MIANRTKKVALDHSTDEDESAQPKLAEYLVYFLLPKKTWDPMIGDLEDDYPTMVTKFGRPLARLWYWKSVLGTIVRHWFPDIRALLDSAIIVTTTFGQLRGHTPPSNPPNFDPLIRLPKIKEPEQEVKEKKRKKKDRGSVSYSCNHSMPLVDLSTRGFISCGMDCELTSVGTSVNANSVVWRMRFCYLSAHTHGTTSAQAKEWSSRLVNWACLCECCRGMCPSSTIPTPIC